MDQRLQRGQIKPKRPYKRKNVSEITSRGVTKKAKRRKDSAASLQVAKQITKRPYNKRQKDPQYAVPHKGRPSSVVQQATKNQNNLIHIEVGTTQVKQNIAKNSQFNPKGLVIIDKLSEFANNYLQNPPRNEEQKKKKKLIEEAEWDELIDRKKKYFEIVNNYPYLKSQEENSNKEKQKKQNEINAANQQEENNDKRTEENKYQMDLEIKNKFEEENNSKIEEEDNNKIEEGNNNYAAGVSNNKAEQQNLLIIDQENQSELQKQGMTENIEKANETKLENNQDQIKEEGEEKKQELEVQEVVAIEQEENNKANQIVILEASIKEEPKYEESNLELQEIKEENDKSSDQSQSVQDRTDQTIKQIQNQQNTFVIEEKIEDCQQLQPSQACQQQPEQEISKVNKSQITSEQLFDFIQKILPTSSTSEKDLFLSLFKENPSPSDASKIVEQKLSSLLENQEQLKDDIKNESFMVKFFQTMKNLVDSYGECLDKQDASYNIYKMNFFKDVFTQTEQALEKINSLLQLKDKQKLTIHNLYNKYNQRLLEM
ncbi:hypothetical protein ABPG72_001238 [Tetrahymena utriculariae]